MHLFRGLSSKLIIPPSVRPCVRPSPILGEAQNICFCTILSEIPENHLCILQYLATVALKTHLHRSSTADAQSPSQSQSVHPQFHRSYRDPCIQNSKSHFFFIFHYFLNGGEATLAADFITAWKPLRGDWKLHRKLGTTL